MSLAAVKLSAGVFDELYAHLLTHNVRYRCMHLREARVVDGERDLRYLHILCATSDAPETIEGLISGPGVFWHYKILRTKSGTQLSVLVERGDERARRRIAKRFVIEILKRVRDEKEKPTYRPIFKKGQYYTKRNRPGSATNDPICKRAVKDCVVDPQFVARLSPWGLLLRQE